jgi:SsrA-binding protein
MGIKVITKNKRAGYDFFLEEKFEAGMQLQGTEVKTLRSGKCVINDAYCTIDKNLEVWLYNLTIPHYEFGNRQNHLENRKRKLLLKKEEIVKMEKNLKTKDQTLIPTMIYFKGSLVKVEIALAKGKKLHDKREATKEKEIKRKLNQGNYE